MTNAHMHISSLWKMCLMFKSSLYVQARGWYFEPFPAYVGMQNARRAKSSPAAVSLCILFYLWSSPFIFPPTAFSLTPLCLRSCSLRYSVLWLQICSDSSPQIQCTLSAFTVATSVCLSACVCMWLWVCSCGVTPFRENKETERE